MSFKIEQHENTSTENPQFFVKEDTGWFFPCESKIQAECLKDKLEEMENQPLDLHKDFEEWDKLNNWLGKTIRRLIEIDSIYESESLRILQEAKENEVDFKALYGGNNKDTRKMYVDEQLYDLIQEKIELQLHKEEDNRKISFLKKQIDMKLELMKYDSN